MKISIFNGTPGDFGGTLDAYLSRFEALAAARGHSVKSFTLRNMDIKYCSGCFGCWVKTPGECVVKDDGGILIRAFVHADLAVFATPVIMGHISALLKKSHDKLLPIFLPYFITIEGEIHHPLRYDRSPDMAVIVDRNGDDEEDLALVERAYRRLSLNLHNTLRLFTTVDRPVEEVVDALAADQRLPQR
jgi:multimeric flavodoxin WrbA